MSKSITITQSELSPIIEDLVSVILSTNKSLCFLKSFDLTSTLGILKENLKKLFSIFELLNNDSKHYLYSIKTLKENLK